MLRLKNLGLFLLWVVIGVFLVMIFLNDKKDLAFDDWVITVSFFVVGGGYFLGKLLWYQELYLIWSCRSRILTMLLSLLIVIGLTLYLNLGNITHLFDKITIIVVIAFLVIEMIIQGLCVIAAYDYASNYFAYDGLRDYDKYMCNLQFPMDAYLLLIEYFACSGDQKNNQYYDTLSFAATRKLWRWQNKLLRQKFGRRWEGLFDIHFNPPLIQ